MTDWRELVRHYRLLVPVRVLVVTSLFLAGFISYVQWMMLFLPLMWLWPEVYWKICYFFRYTGYGAKAAIWWILGYTVVEMGNVVKEIATDKALFLFNHQSFLDAPTQVAMMGQMCMMDTAFLMDSWMKYTTVYGIGSAFCGDIFIQQFLGEDQRKKSLEDVASQMRYMFNGIPQRKWMWYFPEGGLLHKRRPKSQAFARKYGHPVLENVALPRIGALQAMLNALSTSQQSVSNVTEKDQHGSPSQNNNTATQDINANESSWKWIVDATVAYPGGKPLPVSDLATGDSAPCLITICYRVYPAAEVPRDTEGLQKWVFQRFVEKDAMMAHFQKHGCFPEEYLTRGNGLTVISHPLPINWTGWAASFGWAVSAVVMLWLGFKVWSYLLCWMWGALYTLINLLI